MLSPKGDLKIQANYSQKSLHIFSRSQHHIVPGIWYDQFDADGGYFFIDPENMSSMVECFESIGIKVRQVPINTPNQHTQ